jgi:DtxR family Mn-dependent transcriptional regulator
MPSRSIEDYIKNIYHLQAENKNVNTNTLASTLHISAASVSEMVSKLSKSGHIKNTPYRGFKLTKNGEKIAVNLVRKHRLIEVFLKKELKYPWDEVHSEAERFEHVCSDSFIDKLDEYLGYPRFDPHGDPIPDKDGKLKTTKSLPLSNSESGKNYIVSKVNDTDDEVLKYISRIGIKLRTKINIKEKFKFDNSLLVKVGSKDFLLSSKIAENISVVEYHKIKK